MYWSASCAPNLFLNANSSRSSSIWSEDFSTTSPWLAISGSESAISSSPYSIPWKFWWASPWFNLSNAVIANASWRCLRVVSSSCSYLANRSRLASISNLRLFLAFRISTFAVTIERFSPRFSRSLGAGMCGRWNGTLGIAKWMCSPEGASSSITWKRPQITDNFALQPKSNVANNENKFMVLNEYVYCDVFKHYHINSLKIRLFYHEWIFCKPLSNILVST